MGAGMTKEAQQGLASKALAKAEYEEEFASEQGDEGKVAQALTVVELQDLLAPSVPHQTRRVVLGLTTKLREAKREMTEMGNREAGYQEQNRRVVEHNAKLAEERDYWRDLKDPEQVVRALTEEREALRVKVAELEERLAKAQTPTIPAPPPKRTRRARKKGRGR